MKYSRNALTLIMSGKWRVHYNPYPRGADNIKIAGITAIDIGFPFTVLQFNIYARVLFHIDATAIAIFDGFLKCYTKASASAVLRTITSGAQQSFCLRIQFFLTHLFKRRRFRRKSRGNIWCKMPRWLFARPQHFSVIRRRSIVILNAGRTR